MCGSDPKASFRPISAARSRRPTARCRRSSRPPSTPASRAARSTTRSPSCANTPALDRQRPGARLGGRLHDLADRRSENQAARGRGLLEKAGRAIDGIVDQSDRRERRRRAACRRRRSQGADDRDRDPRRPTSCTNSAGTRSTLAEFNLDRHWRNARTHTLHDPVRWKYFHVGNHALNGVAPPRHAWS
jgi:hypothetical protein